MSDTPVNREPDLKDLVSSFKTPKDIHPYERNHCAFPSVTESTHIVKVDGLVSQPLNLSISNLLTDFPQVSTTCVLQCAGNRRHTMRTLQKEVQGLDWFDGAVMNCTWRGPRLPDILLAAGLRDVPTEPDSYEIDAHVAFACHAVECQEDSWYGASIPLSRALREDADVILALEMNGERLSLEHGFPVRVMTPGIAGARAVKWVDTITVQREESQNHYMQYDYKVLPDEAVDTESAKPFWGKEKPIIEMPVNSLVGVPANGSTVTLDGDGLAPVRGYALPSGDDGPVVKVEVSGDEGESWHEATLLSHPDETQWSWKLWETRLKLEPGSGKAAWSRATDAAGNTQPRFSQWNLRGVCYNGYGEARNLTVQG